MPVRKQDSFADLLRKGKESYKAGQAYETGFSKVEPGKYLARLELVDWRKSSNGNLMLHREHVILEGEHKGMKLVDNMVYGMHEIGTGLIRGFIRGAADIDELPDDPADLESLVKEINENPYDCEISVQDQKDSDYQRMTVLKFMNIDDDDNDNNVDSDAAVDESEPVAEDEKENEKKESLLNRMLQFCEEQDVDLDKKKKKDEEYIISEIGGYDYPIEDLERFSGAVDLLEEINCGNNIIRQEPKKVSRKRK